MRLRGQSLPEDLQPPGYLLLSDHLCVRLPYRSGSSRRGADTTGMESPTRNSWLATLTGILDDALRLTGEERAFVGQIMLALLSALDIPDRSRPVSIPAAVAAEVGTGYHSERLQALSPRQPPRAVQANDSAVTVATWSRAILGLLTSAYPDLGAEERQVADTALQGLLLGLGLPERAAGYFPDTVLRAYSAPARS